MPIVQQFDFSAGQYSFVSAFSHPPNSLALINGARVDQKMNTLTKDLGYSQVSTTPETNKGATGIHDFHQDPTTQKILITVNDSTDDDTQLFYKTLAGAWIEVGAAETAWANVANVAVRMETFIEHAFIVGHGSVDGFLPVASFTGTTFSSTANVTNMAQAKGVVRYRDRLYAINTRTGGTNYPFRVYYSSAPSTGAITWTPASDFFDIGFGEEIRAETNHWDKLIIFTRFETFMFDQTQVRSVWKVGAANRQTVDKFQGYLIWTNHEGVWMSANQQQPFKVSDPIKNFIDASIVSNQHAKIIDDVYYLSLGGTITVDSETYTNTMAMLHVPTLTWTIRELGHQVNRLGAINDTDRQRLYICATNGKIYNKGKYTDSTLIKDDDGTAIRVNVLFQPIRLQDVGAKNKIKEIRAYAEKAGSASLKYRILDRRNRALTDFKPLGTIEKYENVFEVLDDAEGTLIQVALSELSGNEHWVYNGHQIEIDSISKVINSK